MTDEKKKTKRKSQTEALIENTVEIINTSTKMIRILTGMSSRKYRYAQLDIMAIYAASLKAQSEAIYEFISESRSRTGG